MWATQEHFRGSVREGAQMHPAILQIAMPRRPAVVPVDPAAPEVNNASGTSGGQIAHNDVAGLQVRMTDEALMEILQATQDMAHDAETLFCGPRLPQKCNPRACWCKGDIRPPSAGLLIELRWMIAERDLKN